MGKDLVKKQLIMQIYSYMYHPDVIFNLLRIWPFNIYEHQLHISAVHKLMLLIVLQRSFDSPSTYGFDPI